jgi:hypothetical protein
MLDRPMQPEDHYERTRAMMSQQLAYVEADWAEKVRQHNAWLASQAPVPPMTSASPPSTVDVAIGKLVTQEGARQGPLNAMRDSLIQQAGIKPYPEVEQLVRNVANMPGVREYVWPQPQGPAPGMIQAAASNFAQQNQSFGLSRLAPGQSGVLPGTASWTSMPVQDGSDLPFFTPPPNSHQDEAMRRRFAEECLWGRR